MDELESSCDTEVSETFDSSEVTTMTSSGKDANDPKALKSGVKAKRSKGPATKHIPPAVDNGLTFNTFLSVPSSDQIFRTHRCPRCDRCFKMRSHLREHLYLHFPDPNLQCPTCKRHFTSKSKLRVHQLREEGLKSHQCHSCQYSAVEHNALRRHLLTVHGETNEESTDLNFTCPVCSETFCQSKSLKIHMKTHNTIKSSTLLSCVAEECTYQNTLFLLLKHITESHDFTPVKCQHHNCMAIFKTQKQMKEHYKTHQAYHCSDCDFSCSNKRLLMQHRRQGHAGSQQLSCEFCDFKTFNSVEFEKHIEHLHASEKIHRCPQCDYTTAHKRGLKRHILTHSGEKPHKCTVCEFKCRDEWYLSRHMLTHCDSKNHMCSECGYVTKWKHYLNVHMRKHTGDLRYHCDQCSYRCHRSDQLSSHKLRHQEKSLICEVCAYSCKRKYELRQHMLSKHSETNQPAAVYKCKYCAYTTSFRQSLHNHENCKHTKAKEFSCALCSYTSFSSISLFLHKRKTHGYIPGDKAWLQHYALKEKEKSTFGNTDGFYTTSTITVEANDVQTPTKIDAMSDFVVSQKVPEQEAVASPNEEYCTLVLTALTSNDEQTVTLQENGKILIGAASEGQTLCENVQPSPSLSSEREDNATFDSEDNDFCQTNQHEKVAAFEESAEDSSTVSPDGTVINNLQERDKMLQSASMVLDGHVEMLMVATTKAGNTARNKPRKILRSQEGKRLGCRKCSQTQKSETSKAISEVSTCLDSPIDQEVVESSSFDTLKLDCNLNLQTKLKALKKSDSLVQDTKSQSALHEKDCAYIKIDNKFQCKQCGFSVVRLTTIERHTSICTKKSVKKMSKVDTKRSEGIAESNTKKMSPNLEKFNCGQCEFATNSLSSLIRHQVLAHKAATLHCKHCSFSCKQERRLLQHIAVKHKNKQNPFQCRFCNFSTKRNYRLEEHESIHTGIGRHSCDVCDKSFGALSKLRKHKLRMHDKTATHFCTNCDFLGFSQDDIKRHSVRCHLGELKFNCGHCGAKFSTQIAFRKHCKRAHQRTLTCKKSDHTCSNCSELNVHGNSKHQMTKVTIFKQISGSKDSDANRKAIHACHLCQFTTKTKALLAEHLLKEHEDGVVDAKSLNCSQCGFTCRYELVLERHLRSHGGKRMYKCTQCEYACANKQKMTWHVRTHTGDKPYSCEECSYTCTEPSRLKQHMRVHQEEKKYLCPECGYKCKWATQLKLHMTKHTGEKRFACPDCEYRSSRADALRSHCSTQHSSSRPFICETCGKSFKTAFVLRSHQQQHSDARPYSCGLCQKAFKWPAGLRHHFMSHIKQAPFCCRLCSYRAKQRFQVIKHLRRHHPQVRAEEAVERDGDVGVLTLKHALEGTVENK